MVPFDYVFAMLLGRDTSFYAELFVVIKLKEICSSKEWRNVYLVK